MTTAITNYSSAPFTGWLPTTSIAADIEQPIGNGDLSIWPGDLIGDGLLRRCSVHVRNLPPGIRDVMLSDLAPLSDDEREPQRRAQEGDILAPVTELVGQSFAWGLKVGYLDNGGAEFQTTWQKTMHGVGSARFHLRLHVYEPILKPGGLARWELTVVAGDNVAADWYQEVKEPIYLDIPGLMTYVTGAGWGAPLLRRGDRLGVSQGRAFCGHFVQSEKVEDPVSATTALQGLVHARLFESDRFGPLRDAADTSRDGALSLLVSSIHEAQADLHDWSPHTKIGGVPNTRRTGGVEDQGWTQASEFFATGGEGHGWLRYLVAMSTGWKRPIHFRTANGLPLGPGDTKGLVLWDGRPHWHHGMSRNRLGRAGDPPHGWANGWSGPDRQHDLIHTLAAASLMRGSPRALQDALEDHARLYLLSDTVDPRVITSGPDAGRAGGWAGLKVAWLWRCLDDRDFAEQVAQRWRERVEQVYIPHIDRDEAILWDRFDDARIWHDMGGKKDYSGAWMPYQQAVAAGGIWIAGEVLNHQPSKDLALNLADQVVQHGYSYPPDEDPIEWDFVAYRDPKVPLPPHEYVQGIGVHRSGWFSDAWTPWAAWVLLRDGGENPQARQIYDANMRRVGKTEWIPPLS